MEVSDWALLDDRYLSGGRTRFQQNAGGAICCIDCDTSLGSAHEAISAGWRDVEADDSESWDFLGYCPACAGRVQEPVKQQLLF